MTPHPQPTYRLFLRAEFPASLIPAPAGWKCHTQERCPPCQPPVSVLSECASGNQEEGMQLEWTFEGEGWVKMWSKSDSEKKIKKGNR